MLPEPVPQINWVASSCDEESGTPSGTWSLAAGGICFGQSQGSAPARYPRCGNKWIGGLALPA